jgi:hypothetical protein
VGGFGRAIEELKETAMADDTGIEASELISALNRAGLLASPASFRPEGVRAEEAIRVIDTLNEAGLLADAASEPPPPPQGRKAGDTVVASRIRWLGKYAIDEPDSGFRATSFRLMDYPQRVKGAATSYVDYYVDCPPSDEGFVAELDKAIAAPRPITLEAKLEITAVLSESTNWSSYRAKLIDLWVTHALIRV